MIKITLANGTVIEMQDGVVLPSWVEHLIGGETVTAEAPAPAPIDDEDLSALAQPPRRPARRYPVHLIGPVHATPHAVAVLGMLRTCPDGLTTRQMVARRNRAELARLTDPQEIEARLVRLVAGFSGHVVGARDRSGLVRQLPKSNLWVASELGKIATVVETGRPASHNRANKRLHSYIPGLRAGEYE